jgi:Ca2+-binding EF-hand superfamily protein
MNLTLKQFLQFIGMCNNTRRLSKELKMAIKLLDNEGFNV